MDYGRLVFAIFVLTLVILTGLTLILYYKDKVFIPTPSIMAPVGPATPYYMIEKI